MIGCRFLSRFLSPCISLVVSLVVGVGLVPGGGRGLAYAQTPSSSSIAEAGKHFQRGVALYNEADYRAALVEFRRAYDIAPNAAVLYNIGQTYYQLQNYAAALSTFNRYLTEAGAAASHRQDVEQTLDTLKARVGRVEVTANAPDCEIAIDDEPVGKTPLGEPVLVSIGRRKVSALCPRHPLETRFVDVAAGDTAQVSLALDPLTGSTPVTAATKSAGSSSDGTRLITAGWITTGVLGAGAVTTGVLAYLASRDLKNARNTYPVSHDDLASKSSRVNKLSIAGDILGAAAVIAGGITLTVTLTRSSSHEMHVAVAPNGIQLAGTFK
jgi:tetratricopeptide (TPR) repeat protein